MKRAEADAAIERVLRSRHHADGRTADRGAAAGAAGCPGADEAAAYVEGGLDADARARFEAHAAACERCLEVLGTMARAMEPPLTDAAADTAAARAHVRIEGPVSWWRSWRLGWAVPVVAAATAGAIYVAVDRDLADLPLPPAGRAATEPAQDQAAQYELRDVPAGPRSEARQELPRRDLEAKASQPPAAGLRAKAPVEAAAQHAGEFAERVAPAAPSATPPPSATPAPATLEARRSEEAQLAVQPDARRGLERDARKQIEPVRAGVAAPVRDEARAPGGLPAWRVGIGGAIERSDDAGATWAAQVSGVRTDLLAVAAPAPDAVWAVGRLGVVLHARDGVTWRRVPFPDEVDLVAVDAGLDRVTVGAADGRRWTTTDGGTSWTPVP